MIIADLIAQKGGQLFTVEPTAPLAKAAQLMKRHGIGAVLVIGNDGRLNGMLSERDIISAVGRYGAQAFRLSTADLMDINVRICHRDETIDAALKIMNAAQIRHVPVIDEDECVVGMISIRDIMAYRIKEQARAADSLLSHLRRQSRRASMAHAVHA